MQTWYEDQRQRDGRDNDDGNQHADDKPDYETARPGGRGQLYSLLCEVQGAGRIVFVCRNGRDRRRR